MSALIIDTDRADEPCDDMESRRERARAILGGRDVKRAAKDLRKLRSDSSRSDAQLLPSQQQSQAQRQRAAYPSHRAGTPLVDDEITDPHEHMARASCAPFRGDYTDADVPDTVREAVDWVIGVGNGPEVAKLRDQAMSIVLNVSKRLQHVENALDEIRPAHIRRMVQPLRASLITALALASDAPEAVGLGVDVVCGFQAVGDIPDCGWWIPVDNPAKVDFDSLDHDAWNRALESAIRAKALAASASRKAELETVYQKTLAEHAKGLVHGPFTKKHLDQVYGRGKWRAMARFGILQNGKVRACDNAKASYHNRGTGRGEKMACETADFPARTSACFRRSATAAAGGTEPPRLDMQSGTDDMRDAYRHLPCATPQFTVFALWSPELGEVVYFTLPGFNFGLSSAVGQFNRLPESFVNAARRLLHIACCHFFDDFNVTEPGWSARSAQSTLGRLLVLVGFPFSDEKHEEVAPIVKFLGVFSDLVEFDVSGIVKMYVSESRIEKLLAHIRLVLEEGSLSPGEASRIAGKLGFTFAWSFGRFGKAALQPLHARAADNELGEWGESLPPSLRASLSFFESVLPELRPHLYRADEETESPTLVWTDGRYDMEGHAAVVAGRDARPPAGVGFVIASPKPGVRPACGSCPEYMSSAEARVRLADSYTFVHASLDVPDEFVAGFIGRKQYIGQIEILGALSPYLSCPELLAGKRVIHWIDNTSAISALNKGYSARPDSARLVHAFHAFNLGLEARVWFEYVNTDANVSDAPSRDDLTISYYDFGFAAAPGMGSTPVPLIIPATQRWSDAAAAWTREARLSG